MKTNLLPHSIALILISGSLVTLTSCDVARSVANQYGIEIPNGSQSAQTSTPTTTGPAIDATSFENSSDGWKIVGDAQGGYVDPVFRPNGGVTGGYIYAKDDVTGGVWYFSAPRKYLGNRPSYYGATLNYSLFQQISGGASPFEDKDIVIKSGKRMIYYQMDAAEYPRNSWTHYAVRITANSGWKNTDGNPASAWEMKSVLSNITALLIRGEYQQGADEGGLDNVRIN